MFNFFIIIGHSKYDKKQNVCVSINNNIKFSELVCFTVHLKGMNNHEKNFIR